MSCSDPTSHTLNCLIGLVQNAEPSPSPKPYFGDLLSHRLLGSSQEPISLWAMKEFAKGGQKGGTCDQPPET